MSEDHFIDKTTSIKTVERIAFKAIPFAKGYKVEVKWAFNPEDSIHVDQLLNADKDKNVILAGLEGFIKNVIEGQLSGNLIKDE